MIKYKYIPFTMNKPRYTSLPQTNWQLKAQMPSSVSETPAPDSAIASNAAVAVSVDTTQQPTASRITEI